MPLTVDHLSAWAQNDRQILHDISFSLARGSSVAIMGPSGSGKTTLANAILGLAGPIKLVGEIRKAGVMMKPVTARKFGYVPQNLALWPHLSVKQCLELSHYFGFDKHAINEDWLTTLINLCGLKDLMTLHPRALSGGEKQRLALARALAVKPELLILDEPFCALDIVAKRSLIALVNDLGVRLSVSIIFISHDMDEALAIGQQIMILNKGHITWYGPREKLSATTLSHTWNPLSHPAAESAGAIELALRWTPRTPPRGDD